MQGLLGWDGSEWISLRSWHPAHSQVPAGFGASKNVTSFSPTTWNLPHFCCGYDVDDNASFRCFLTLFPSPADVKIQQKNTSWKKFCPQMLAQTRNTPYFLSSYFLREHNPLDFLFLPAEHSDSQAPHATLRTKPYIGECVCTCVSVCLCIARGDQEQQS